MLGHKIHFMSYCNLGDETVIGTLGEDNKMKIFTLETKKKDSKTYENPCFPKDFRIEKTKR
jgi:hypothetical protein